MCLYIQIQNVNFEEKIFVTRILTNKSWKNTISNRCTITIIDFRLCFFIRNNSMRCKCCMQKQSECIASDSFESFYRTYEWNLPPSTNDDKFNSDCFNATYSILARIFERTAQWISVDMITFQVLNLFRFMMKYFIIECQTILSYVLLRLTFTSERPIILFHHKTLQKHVVWINSTTNIIKKPFNVFFSVQTKSILIQS